MITFSEDDLAQMMIDLFNAGGGTTSVNLVWCVLYLATFPHVQEKLQKEIDENLPKGSYATLEDRAKLVKEKDNAMQFY